MDKIIKSMCKSILKNEVTTEALVKVSHNQHMVNEMIMKTLRKQARKNVYINIFVLSCAMYAVFQELRIMEQDEKIERLSNKIEELKLMKGI